MKAGTRTLIAVGIAAAVGGGVLAGATYAGDRHGGRWHRGG